MSGAADMFSLTEGEKYAIDLLSRYNQMLRDRIQVDGPSDWTRASSVGSDCARAIFYDRTLPAVERAPHEPEVQELFDLGNEMEAIVIRQLQAMGATVDLQQHEVEDAKLELRGHSDVCVRLPDWPRAIRAEIKGLNPHTHSSLRTVEDIRDHKSEWVRRYYSQMQAYLMLSQEPVGLFILKNKSTGRLEVIPCPSDPIHQYLITDRAKRIKAAVFTGEAPERTEGPGCARCPFRLACEPDLNRKARVANAVVTDDLEVLALAERREALKAAHKEYDEVDKALKDALKAMPGKGEVMLGAEFVAVRSEVHRKAFTTKESTYVKVDIRRVVDTDGEAKKEAA